MFSYPAAQSATIGRTPPIASFNLMGRGTGWRDGLPPPSNLKAVAAANMQRERASRPHVPWMLASSRNPWLRRESPPNRAELEPILVTHEHADLHPVHGDWRGLQYINGIPELWVFAGV